MSPNAGLEHLLGFYRTDGISNGEVRYKNDKDNHRYLHLDPTNGWMVCTPHYVSK